MIWRGCNGNRMNGLGFRSMTSSADTGPSGALVITDDGTYQSDENNWNGTWFEYLHVPTNGTLINNKANGQKFRDTYFVDCSKESGATGTSYVTFAPSAFTDSGANVWSGLVPGKDPGNATSFDTGINVTQSRNRIEGVKGYKGTNVTLASGVGFTFVTLGGESSGATDAAVVDNSGQTTNVVIDSTQGLWNQTVGKTVVGATCYIGNTSGPYFLNSGGALYPRSDSTGFQALDATPILSLNKFQPRVTVNGDMAFSGGKLRRALSTKTANYTILANDEITIFNGTSLTATLPDPTLTGTSQYIVKNINASALTVNSAGASKTIDGAASQSLAQWASGRYVSDGTQWLTV
jgi:hypothetical protein